MTPLMILLCLGPSVGAGTPMQEGTLPRPTLWAEPGSVIPQGSSMTFWCQGTPGAQKYVLEGHGNDGVLGIELPLESGDKVKFPMNITGFSYAARYTCEQCGLSGCSEKSNPLQLIVTGAYNKPFLSILSNPVLTSGSNVTLQCHSQKKFKGFALTQEGEPGPSQTLDSQPHPNGTFHALFSVGPLSPGYSWTFRCYGYMNKDQVWSQPSNPLQLLISDPPRLPAHHQDYTVGNVGRMLVGAVVLLLLGILLVEAHLSQRRSQGPSGAGKGNRSFRMCSLGTQMAINSEE